VRLIGDLVMSVLVGLAVASGLGWVGAGVTFGLPGGLSGAVGMVAGVGYFIWRREDPEAHLSERERLERQLFGD
jgi:hypothetical protein